MKDIKFKAETSEKIVKEIVADIKTLDNANHNLSNTISVLRRFNMYCINKNICILCLFL